MYVEIKSTRINLIKLHDIKKSFIWVIQEIVQPIQLPAHKENPLSCI